MTFLTQALTDDMIFQGPIAYFSNKHGILLGLPYISPIFNPHQYPPHPIKHVHAHDHRYRINALANPLCRHFPFLISTVPCLLHRPTRSLPTSPPFSASYTKPKPKEKRGSLTKYQIRHIQSSQARLFRGRQFGPGAVLGHADGSGERCLKCEKEECEIEDG